MNLIKTYINIIVIFKKVDSPALSPIADTFISWASWQSSYKDSSST
jgi:hypothetical protein